MVEFGAASQLCADSLRSTPDGRDLARRRGHLLNILAALAVNSLPGCEGALLWHHLLSTPQPSPGSSFARPAEPIR